MNIIKGFPERYKDATPPIGDKWIEAFNKSKPVVESGGILVTYGTNGTGKSRMAYELAKVCNMPRSEFPPVGMSSIRKSRPCYYTTAVMLFMELRESFTPKAEMSEMQIVKKYSEAAFLVIDEIQERGETSFEDRKLTSIIDARYADGRPTMLISNYSREKFAQAMSPAILDRIRENGLGLHFDWESYRKQSAI
jgi:DNA replication protein DnaC